MGLKEIVELCKGKKQKRSTTLAEMNSLFKKEQRDPTSIRLWLVEEGFDEKIINEVIFEYAKRLDRGEKFGYKDGISILSNKIRDRVAEVTKAEKSLRTFADFSKAL